MTAHCGPPSRRPTGVTTINVPAGTYTLDDTKGYLSVPDTGVGGSITINGDDSSNTIIEAATTPGAATVRVFRIAPSATATISNVTIQNGNSANTGGGGGGILNRATLDHEDSVVQNNAANGNGGGIYTETTGVTTLGSDTIVGNTSGADGGGIYADAGTMTLTGDTVSDNTAHHGRRRRRHHPGRRGPDRQRRDDRRNRVDRSH